MTSNHADDGAFEEPLAALERQFIAEYLEAAGLDYHTLLMRHDDEARRILAHATLHASERLSEIEARSHFLDNLHGEGEG
jgi:hypothetical protein